MRYSPSEFVTSDRLNPVAVLVAVTVTPGIAACCASVIRPVIVPVVCCAIAGAANASTATSAIIEEMIFLMPCLPPLNECCQGPVPSLGRTCAHGSPVLAGMGQDT